MVFSYVLAQLLPEHRGRVDDPRIGRSGGPGFLLVLGSANVDEGLRGYMTKYDCSSADVNPIGSISKLDLKKFLRWAATHLGFSSLIAVVDAVPTAELRPIDNDDASAEEGSKAAGGSSVSRAAREEARTALAQCA